MYNMDYGLYMYVQVHVHVTMSIHVFVRPSLPITCTSHFLGIIDAHHDGCLVVC
jgi:hypothetical protein